ncbi:UvrB/UvrC motif-containing protein [Bythopirellula polymerisocia]|uniref:UvrB/uvrC motif protein n=1 Tax=Bythopirellula polymerisocia TaxID=2528003 RepID=A0A5C6CLI2_9BACT|nr:UvrB/UvrC motif-containing protein [Bythopirellula polymerisocia]TWU23699.1 UvrB/uvrC motif protein [Bythopirellula polymerisocia]
MPKRIQHLDRYLSDWPFVPGQVMVREVKGSDKRPLLQLRVDMGIVQMEVVGRPDGEKPEGFDTYYDNLLSQSFADGPAFQLDRERCREIDREFYQYYHRRVCWLTLNRYAEAVRDAEHTLALMDFSTANSPDPQWSLMHEQYRPFVMFHKIQALTLIQLEKSNHRGAVEAIDQGIASMQKLFEAHAAEDVSDEDTLLEKLQDMKASIAKHYDVGPSLAEQLAQAIASEQYELAAKLRDRMDGSPKN